MRTVPEWIGKNDDTPAPSRVKLRVFKRFGGVCQICFTEIVSGAEFDHCVAVALGGPNCESNLQPVHPRCHKAKTRDDVADKAANYRTLLHHVGIKKPRNPMPGSKASGWRKRMNGTVERRNPMTTADNDTTTDYTAMSEPEMLSAVRDDAYKWAEAFIQTKKKMGWTLDNIDHGLMIGWFANAIENSEIVRRPPGECPKCKDYVGKCPACGRRLRSNSPVNVPSAEVIASLICDAYCDLDKYGNQCRAREAAQAILKALSSGQGDGNAQSSAQPTHGGR